MRHFFNIHVELEDNTKQATQSYGMTIQVDEHDVPTGHEPSELRMIMSNPRDILEKVKNTDLSENDIFNIGMVAMRLTLPVDVQINETQHGYQGISKKLSQPIKFGVQKKEGYPFFMYKNHAKGSAFDVYPSSAQEFSLQIPEMLAAIKNGNCVKTAFALNSDPISMTIDREQEKAILNGQRYQVTMTRISHQSQRYL